MIATLTTLRAAKSNPDMVDDTMAEKTAATVGTLVAGMDETKGHAISDQVADWIKKGLALSDADFATQQPALEAEAAKLVGTVTTVDVLNHWIQQQIALLLSNPQTSTAVAALQAAHAAK